MHNLTILIPCFENPLLVKESVEKNRKIFSTHPIIVINKNGGEAFKEFGIVIKQNSSFWSARRFGLELVKTKYVLCLDVDTILPLQYIEQAIQILERKPKVGAIALNYAQPLSQDHLAFGTSIWRTEQLKQLYDWRLTEKQYNTCECKYMWKKVEKEGMKIETLPMEAIHIKHPIRINSSA
jgi:hypothetical protein